MLEHPTGASPVAIEVDESGNVTVRRGINYAQQTYQIPACFGIDNQLDLIAARRPRSHPPKPPVATLPASIEVVLTRARLDDAGEDDGVAYIAMRFVNGHDLKAMIAEYNKLEPGSPATAVVQPEFE